MNRRLTQWGQSTVGYVKFNQKERPGPSGLESNSKSSVTHTGATVLLVPPQPFACKTCKRTIPLSWSLGMHRHHAYPEKLNEERVEVLTNTPRRWSQDQDEEVLYHANAIWKSGQLKKTTLAELHRILPHRSVDAFKKHLLTLKWPLMRQEWEVTCHLLL